MTEYLFDTADVLGRRVFMTVAQWDDHVLRPKPWMHQYQHLVQQAVEHPTFINYDVDYSDRENYYAANLIPVPGDILKVVVTFTNPAAGRGITAFIVTKPKPGERPRWPPRP